MIITPTTELGITLTGPSDSLVEPGREFGINITIQHASNQSRDAHDLLVYLYYDEQYVSPPSIFHKLFGHGYANVIGKS